MLRASSALTLLGPGGSSANAPSVPYRIFSSGIPSGIPSSGTIGNNGALTLTTALDSVYGPSGVSPGVWLYFPAGAVYAGSLVGSYWTVMTSNTAGTIYNNTLTVGSGLQSPPVTPTPIVATGPGAYTQLITVSNTFDLISFTLPGNSLGKNGQLRLYSVYVNNNSATAKNSVVKLGGNFFTNIGTTTNTTYWFNWPLTNLGQTNSQIFTGNFLSADTGTTGGPGRSTIDTTANTIVSMSAYLNAAATDWIICQYLIATVTYAP